MSPPTANLVAAIGGLGAALQRQLADGSATEIQSAPDRAHALARVVAAVANAASGSFAAVVAPLRQGLSRLARAIGEMAKLANATDDISSPLRRLAAAVELAATLANRAAEQLVAADAQGSDEDSDVISSDSDDDSDGDDDVDADIEDADHTAALYRRELEDEQVQEVEELMAEGAHLLHAERRYQGPPPRQVTHRIFGEIADFQESLPCEPSHAFFVRYDEDMCDFMKVMITGAVGTPYEGGCFVFDVYCNPRYGQEPPRVLLETTGANTIRFNPNLYRSGKVCLSLLGTWEGNEPGEMWSPSSSLLQVFVSIQSMVMTARPIDCEPGEEGRGGADLKNAGYIAVIRYGTVRHAMVGQIESPSPFFRTATRKHFALIKGTVLETVREWVAEAPETFPPGSFDGIVQEHNPELCRLFGKPGAYKAKMVGVFERLQKALAEI